MADGIEGLHKARAFKLALQALHQRLIKILEEPQDAVCGCVVCDRVRLIDDELFRQICVASVAQDLRRDRSIDRQHDHLAELCRIGKATDPTSGMLSDPVLQLGRRTRSHHDGMAMLQKAASQ